MFVKIHMESGAKHPRGSEDWANVMEDGEEIDFFELNRVCWRSLTALCVVTIFWNLEESLIDTQSCIIVVQGRR